MAARKLRRCNPCDINWPFQATFDFCPGCSLPTEDSDADRYGDPLEYGPACTLKAQLQKRAIDLIRFEEHCQRREREHRLMCADYDADQLGVAAAIVAGFEQLLGDPPPF